MIAVIVAVANGGVIGGGNSLLWHIAEDLKRFKAITSGHPVIMGRKTFESLGRPLPNRVNVVVTRNEGYKPEGCTVVGSLDEAVALFDPQDDIFIIGGGEIYRQSMPIADRLFITHVYADYEGDTFFPEIDPQVWEATYRERHEHGEKFPHAFEYVNYERK